ncbi:hypothetical protein [Delftia acidovorans]|uniref:hypothetical protein n=1 Tax=Delftia acidovorans TaxID=80866 RepID=UPI00241EE76A|nr:hypothetical protein [Delftia acidovorans]
MLNTDLWISFEKNLSSKDIEDIENRLIFLKTSVEDAIVNFSVEDVESDLDLNLHIYLQYFLLKNNDDLSPWLIHDGWLYYYLGTKEVNQALKDGINSSYRRYADDILGCLEDIIEIINAHDLILRECDAVVWLSFLDYLVTRLIAKIGENRLKFLFDTK